MVNLKFSKDSSVVEFNYGSLKRCRTCLSIQNMSRNPQGFGISQMNTTMKSSVLLIDYLMPNFVLHVPLPTLSNY